MADEIIKELWEVKDQMAREHDVARSERVGTTPALEPIAPHSHVQHLVDVGFHRLAIGLAVRGCLSHRLRDGVCGGCADLGCGRSTSNRRIRIGYDGARRSGFCRYVRILLNCDSDHARRSSCQCFGIDPGNARMVSPDDDRRRRRGFGGQRYWAVSRIRRTCVVDHNRTSGRSRAIDVHDKAVIPAMECVQ